MDDLIITTRLLPLQVLGRRATNTSYKYRSLLRMLHLETGDVDIVKSRTRTFLGDMGVESKLPIVPELDVTADTTGARAFPLSLPFHDMDHAMHHVMEEITSSWPNDIGVTFDKQLRALSKFFSKRDLCQRFCKMRIWDSAMPYSAKVTLSKIMMNTCPVFVQHRWEYRYHVLQWICEREQLLALLDPSTVDIGKPQDDSDNGDQLSDMDVQALQLLYANPDAAETFWAMAYSSRLLCQWGRRIVGWLHGCWCHSSKGSREQLQKDTHKSCKWSGRRLIELACGASSSFVKDLKSLAVERDKLASHKISVLRRSKPEVASHILQGFATAKNMIEGRFLQVTAFLQETPWNLVKMLRYLIVQTQDAAEAINQSRADAHALLSNYSSGKL